MAATLKWWGRWSSVLVFCVLAGGRASAEDIVLGMSAAFTGPSRGLSIELYRGSMAYLGQVNQAGGIYGKNVVIKAYDDGYNPIPAIHNTIRLVEQDDVFALYGYMGSPTTVRILPLLKAYDDRSMFLFFPFTGAEPQRRQPHSDYVFNLRTSYSQETVGLVEHFLEIGRKRIGVFYQLDAYGKSGWDGVRRTLARHDRTMAGDAAYRRGTPYANNFREQVDILRQQGADAVISIATYEAAAGFVRDARDAGWDVPIANVSGVDSENMLRLLTETGKARGKDYTANLINTQVVPSYHQTDLPAVQEYRRLMDHYNQEPSRLLPPRELLDQDYEPPQYSFISFEGFLNAKVLVEVLRRMSPDDIARKNRGAIRDAVEGIDQLPIGIDVPVSFGPGKHQGLPRNKVYYTVLREGRFEPLADADWKGWRP
jgi:ABC-type branched-subunit amino acid transport system substrate-binding protein